jgi:hypothetical protein
LLKPLFLIKSLSCVSSYSVVVAIGIVLVSGEGVVVVVVLETLKKQPAIDTGDRGGLTGGL